MSVDQLKEGSVIEVVVSGNFVAYSKEMYCMFILGSRDDAVVRVLTSHQINVALVRIPDPVSYVG